MELTRQVLDRIRAHDERATLRCPVFRSFIECDPEYAAIADENDSGMVCNGDV